jgi:hypothetical protein
LPSPALLRVKGAIIIRLAKAISPSNTGENRLVLFFVTDDMMYFQIIYSTTGALV